METRTGKPTGVRGVQRLGKDRAGRQKWRVRVKYRDPSTGIVRDVEKRVLFESLKEANRFRVDWIRELETPKDPTKSEQQMTLRELVERYIKTKTPDWKPATLKNNTAILGGLKPLFDIPVGNITGPAIAHIFQSKNLAPATWNLQKHVIGSMFAWAMMNDFATSNPTNKIQTKAKTKKYNSSNPGHLSGEQIKPFLDYVKKNHPTYYPLCLLGIQTGIRSGSIRVLRPEDIRDGFVNVVRGLSGHGNLVDSTKTGDHHQIPIEPNVQKVCLDYWASLPEYRKKEGWLFPSESGGVISEPAFNHVVKTAGESVGVKMTAHGLRRTTSHQVRQNADLKTAKTITGHSGDDMFLHYSEPEQRERIEAVRKAFGGVLGLEDGLDPEGGS